MIVPHEKGFIASYFFQVKDSSARGNAQTLSLLVEFNTYKIDLLNVKERLEKVVNEYSSVLSDYFKN